MSLRSAESHRGLAAAEALTFVIAIPPAFRLGEPHLRASPADQRSRVRLRHAFRMHSQRAPSQRLTRAASRQRSRGVVADAEQAFALLAGRGERSDHAARRSSAPVFARVARSECLRDGRRIDALRACGRESTAFARRGRNSTTSVADRQRGPSPLGRFRARLPRHRGERSAHADRRSG